MFSACQLSRLAVGIFVMGSAPFISTQAFSEEQKRTITLSATGSVEAKPDVVFISTAVETFEKSAQDSVKNNSEAMTRIITALKARGIDSKYIQTTNFSVQPEYESYQVKQKENRNPEIIGYRVINDVRLTITDVAKLGAILDEVVTLGANRISGISFTVKNADQLMDSARKKAMQEAIRRAKLYTTAAGVKLGQVVSITESVNDAPQGPVMRMRAFAKADSSVPIQAGANEIEVQVTVTWKLD